MKTRIMYIESKGGGISGPARVGRVTYTKSGKGTYYKGRLFLSLSGFGFKANFFDSETHEEYWISGPKRKGGDRLYPGLIEIDPDVREEYWAEIRRMPEKKEQKTIRCTGKYAARVSSPPLRPAAVWRNFGLGWCGWQALGSAPDENHFTVPRRSETGVLWCRIRDQKGNSDSFRSRH
jgi:hypothetical protein